MFFSPLIASRVCTCIVRWILTRKAYYSQSSGLDTTCVLFWTILKLTCQYTTCVTVSIPERSVSTSATFVFCPSQQHTLAPLLGHY